MADFRFKVEDWESIYQTLLLAPRTDQWKKSAIRKSLEATIDRWRRFGPKRTREARNVWLNALSDAEQLQKAIDQIRNLGRGSADGAALVDDEFLRGIDNFERLTQGWKRRTLGCSNSHDQHRDLLLNNLMDCWEAMGGEVGYAESGGKFMRFLMAVMDSLKIDLAASAARWAIRKHQQELIEEFGAASYDDALARAPHYPFSFGRDDRTGE